MSVSFTGIKNVGSMFIMMPETNYKMNVLSMQLTNDESGNDLDEFKKAIEKTGKPEKYTSGYEGTVNINISTLEPEEEYLKPQHKFYLNGSYLEVKDRNLPVFTYLARVANKITDKSGEELGTDMEYIQSPDFINGTSLGYFLKQTFRANPQINLLPLLNGIYKPSVAKAGAEIVSTSIDDTMSDYFA